MAVSSSGRVRVIQDQGVRGGRDLPPSGRRRKAGMAGIKKYAQYYDPHYTKWMARHLGHSLNVHE